MTTTEKVAAALDLLPEQFRESAVAYLVEQAEKYRLLKIEIDKGLDDVKTGRVSEWDFADFLRRARSVRSP
jgi:hypothetical protein